MGLNELSTYIIIFRTVLSAYIYVYIYIYTHIYGKHYVRIILCAIILTSGRLRQEDLQVRGLPELQSNILKERKVECAGTFCNPRSGEAEAGRLEFKAL